MRAIAMLCAWAALSAPASADPDRIYVLARSYHAGAAMPFVEENPGLFLRWEGDPLDWSVGTYRNSYGRQSIAVLAGADLIEWDGGALGLFGGLAHYPQDGRTFPVHWGDVVPLAGIEVRHRGLFVQVMPGDGRAVDAVVAAGIYFDF